MKNYKIKTLVSDIKIVGLQEIHIKGSGIVMKLTN